MTKKVDALEERWTGEFEALRTTLKNRMDERVTEFYAAVEQRGTPVSAT